jgi:hypothetical protein
VRFCAGGVVVGDDVTGGVTLVVAVVFLFALSSEAQAANIIADARITISGSRFRLIFIAIYAPLKDESGV